MKPLPPRRPPFEPTERQPHQIAFSDQVRIFQRNLNLQRRLAGVTHAYDDGSDGFDVFTTCLCDEIEISFNEEHKQYTAPDHPKEVLHPLRNLEHVLPGTDRIAGTLERQALCHIPDSTLIPADNHRDPLPAVPCPRTLQPKQSATTITAVATPAAILAVAQPASLQNDLSDFDSFNGDDNDDGDNADQAMFAGAASSSTYKICERYRAFSAVAPMSLFALSMSTSTGHESERVLPQILGAKAAGG